MSGLAGAINTALSGIDVFEEGIQTIGNNIANEATPGYAIRTLMPETSVFGSGRAGSGVINPAAVQRAADAFAAGRLNAATAANEAAQTLSGALSAIDQSLQGNGNVQSTMNQFFADLTTLASDPTNSSQAQTVMADAQNIVSAFQSATQSLSGQFTTISGSMQQNVASANQLLQGLATVNSQLATDPGNNSLLDQQQADLSSLSQIIGVSTVPLSNGAIEVTANGVVLLDQSGAQTLSVSQTNPSATPVLTVGNAKTPLDPASGSGSLGGSLAAFGNTQNTVQALNWFAGAFAGLINQAQAEGLNGSGNQGSPLFSVPPPQVSAAAANTGSATLSANVTNAASLPSNGQGYVLAYGASGWTATVPGTTQSYTLGAGPTLTLPGLSVTVGGTPNNGDSFTIDPEPGAAEGLSLLTTSSSAIAAADPYAVTAGTVGANGAVTNNNAGTESMLSETVTATPSSGATIVPASAFGQNLTLTFTSANAYTVTNGAGTTVASGTWSSGTTLAIAYPSGSPAAGQYWQVSLDGSPASGDVVSLTPGGLDSGSNAKRMADLWTASSNLPGGSLQGSILSLIGTAGANAEAAQSMATATSENVTTAQDNLTAIAGVDPNQQAVVLTQYQQAFQAASMVVSTAHSMFESLMTAIG
jgi:flagellar hook-associated protein 1